MNGLVSTRPVRLPADADVLLAVYRSTRQREVDMFGWTDAEADAFVTSQFEAQSRHYRTYYPGAEHSVVLVDGLPAGRLLVERSKSSIHIVDLSLLPAFRGAGVGRELVQTLIGEADARGVPVTCNVEVGNPARIFWQRLGFEARSGEETGYVALERPCEISAR
jgi:ribosomal protein S18 acetylase RimI-like enzyme